MIHKGKLRITKFVKNIEVSQKKPYNIIDFDISIEFHGKECLFELDNNEVTQIEVTGKIFSLEKKCKNQHKYKIPKDTCIVMENQSINNFHLKLNKFAQFNSENGYKLQYQDIKENFFNKNWNFYHSKIENYYKNIQKLNLNFSEPIDLDIHYRLLIGAEQSIYETSIRLHHIYGIPYIPSTAIKGVVRSYTIQKKYKNSEERALDSEEFKKWFGSQEQEGIIIFFDTFPISEPKIKMDIINPMEETKIINFLTIEDATFQFLIAFKDEIDKEFIVLFKKALQEHGIGAKTAVGYGYFEVQKPKKR